MIDFYYKNHLGEIFNFRDVKTRIRAANLHEFAWKPTDKASRPGMARLEKDAVTYAVTMQFREPLPCRKKLLNALYTLLDKDAMTNQPGRLYFGEYYTECLPISSKTEPEDFYTAREIGFYSPSGMWIKEIKTEFRPGVDNGGYLDFPYDHPIDFASGAENQGGVTNVSPADADFVLEFLGPCRSPAVIIDSHLYRVNADVRLNERIVVDSMSKKIYKIAWDGTRENLFNFRERDSYIFKKIAPGTVPVIWDGDLAFNLTIIQERSEPEWI